MENIDRNFVGFCPVCDARALITETEIYEWCQRCGWVGASRLPDDESPYMRKGLTIEKARQNWERFRCIDPEAREPSFAAPRRPPLAASEEQQIDPA